MGKTDGVIIYASAASMFRGRLREFGGATEGVGVRGHSYLNFFVV